jgi:hypothetical protein
MTRWQTSRRSAVAAALAVPLLVTPVLPTGSALADGGSRPTTKVYSTADSDAVRDGQFTSSTVWRYWRGDPSVLAVNEAIASSRCTKCRAVAVAVQILVVSHVTLPKGGKGGPSKDEVNVENLALGLTLDRRRNGVHGRDAGPAGGEPVVTNRTATVCASCSTVALAYQFVLVSPKRLALKASARDQLQVLEGRMRAVAASRLPNLVIQERENALARQVATVLSWGVVRVPEPVGRRT